LPFHLKQRKKVICNETEVDKSLDVIYLDEEVMPSHLQKGEDLTLVRSVSFPNKNKTKQCKPIGLSRKRKSLESTVNDSKYKQITFEKFAFKRKSVC